MCEFAVAASNCGWFKQVEGYWCLSISCMCGIGAVVGFIALVGVMTWKLGVCLFMFCVVFGVLRLGFMVCS
jgi:hypothetical protein